MYSLLLLLALAAPALAGLAAPRAPQRALTRMEEEGHDPPGDSHFPLMYEDLDNFEYTYGDDQVDFETETGDLPPSGPAAAPRVGSDDYDDYTYGDVGIEFDTSPHWPSLPAIPNPATGVAIPAQPRPPRRRDSYIDTIAQLLASLLRTMEAAERFWDKLSAATKDGLDFLKQEFSTLRTDLKGQMLEVVEDARRALDKLDGKLRDGNRFVKDLFEAIGRRTRHSYSYQHGVLVVDVGEDVSVFQDAEVEAALDRLVQRQDLTLEDAEAIKSAAIMAARREQQ